MPKIIKNVTNIGGSDDIHSDGGGIKKPRKVKRRIKRQKTVNEIRRLQLMTVNLIPLQPISRLIKEILQKVESDNSMKTIERIQDPDNQTRSLDGSSYPGRDTINTMRIRKKAIKILIDAAEYFLVTQFEASQLMAIHSGRVTVKPIDMINANKVNAILKGEESVLMMQADEEKKLLDMNKNDSNDDINTKIIKKPSNKKKIIIKKKVKGNKVFNPQEYLKNMDPTKKHGTSVSIDLSNSSSKSDLSENSEEDDSGDTIEEDSDDSLDEEEDSDEDEYDSEEDDSDDSDDESEEDSEEIRRKILLLNKKLAKK